MRTAISLNDFIFRGDADFDSVADHVVAAERLGVDTVWSAEAWGTDGDAVERVLVAEREGVAVGSVTAQHDPVLDAVALDRGEPRWTPARLPVDVDHCRAERVRLDDRGRLLWGEDPRSLIRRTSRRRC